MTLFKPWRMNMRKLLLAAAACLFVSPAFAGGTLVTPAAGYPFNAAGMYFGLGAEALAGTPTDAGVGLVAAGAALTLDAGYQWKGGLDFMAIEALVSWTNLGTNGASCGGTPCSVAANFDVEERFKFGFPWQVIQAVMPNWNNVFPGLPTVNVSNVTGVPHPYVFAGVVETPVTASAAGFANQVWQVQAELGAGILHQVNQGLVMDVWAGMTIPSSTFNIGAGGFTVANANLGKQFRAGLTFNY